MTESELNPLEEEKNSQNTSRMEMLNDSKQFFLHKIDAGYEIHLKMPFFVIFCEIINFKWKSVGASHIKLVQYVHSVVAEIQLLK